MIESVKIYTEHLKLKGALKKQTTATKPTAKKETKKPPKPPRK